MKKIYLFIIAALTGMFTIQSCIIETITDQIESTIDNGTESLGIKSYNDAGYLELKIHNIAENTCLLIDSMEICNIMIIDENTGKAVKGNIKVSRNSDTARIYCGHYIVCNKTTLPVQEFTPWDQYTLPEKSIGMYVKMNGTMYTFLANGEPFPLYEGNMYFTFYARINKGQTTQAGILIYDNCQLYCQIDGKISKVLQSIQFDPSIIDWR